MKGAPLPFFVTPKEASQTFSCCTTADPFIRQTREIKTIVSSNESFDRMLKHLLCSMALAALAFSATAQSITDSSLNFDFKPGTYYGSKAGKTPFNPCAGKCTAICAEIKLVSGPLENGIQIPLPGISRAAARPYILWRVPAEFPEEDFLRIKARERQYDNLRVVRGLEDETDDTDALD